MKAFANNTRHACGRWRLPSFVVLLVVAVATVGILTGRWWTSSTSTLEVLLSLRGGLGEDASNGDTEASSSLPRVHQSKTSAANMNGKYRLSPTPGAKDTYRLFPTNYADYPPAGSNRNITTRYFDTYSPQIQQLYSQVFWKSLPPVPLPDSVVQEFQDKAMAVIGFELDQVLTLQDGTERSIPMNALYNHHFESTMIGGQAQFQLVQPSDDEPLPVEPDSMDTTAPMGHGRSPHQPYYKVQSRTTTGITAIPDHAAFGGANGGEVRKSFHGYAPGFAQMIQSPKQFQITPMEIDTWHREAMDIASPTQFPNFVPGPLPRNSLAPRGKEEAPPLYSGLLECPVTTRITKHVPVHYQLWNGGTKTRQDEEVQSLFRSSSVSTCPQGLHSLTTADACFEAVASLLPDGIFVRNISGSTEYRPAGCSVSAQHQHQHHYQQGKWTVQAYFNTATPDATANITPCGRAGTNGSNPPRYFYATSHSDSLVSWSMYLDTTDANQVELTLTGPADVWYAVGFGAQSMKDRPWTIVVEPDPQDDSNAKLSERVLGDHVPGAIVDPPTLTLVNVTWDQENNLKTIQVTRPAKGHPYFDFTMDTDRPELFFLRAIGSSPTFGYHQAKEASSTVMLPVTNHNAGGACVCESDPPPFGKTQGSKLEYHPVPHQPGEQGRNDRVAWNNQCDSPRTNLLEQHNPTCDIRTYTGGQVACHHMWSLLDADQVIPWPDQPLEYRLKFRFWYQDYDETYHQQVYRATWGIASPVEYDVPKCAPDVPGCSQDEHGQWIHTIEGAFVVHSGPLVAAHFHCHAPTCLETSLYMCDRGTQPQDCNATTGRLICRQDAKYHGEGQEDEDGRFQEPGFIAQPPCLWGSPEYGLEEPVEVAGRTMFATKTANATYGHHGEMAWLQVYYYIKS